MLMNTIMQKQHVVVRAAFMTPASVAILLAKMGVMNAARTTA